MPTSVDAAPREIRLTFAYCGNAVDAIARQAGFPMTDQEVAAILEHIDLEIDSVAQSAAAAAIAKRIHDLIEAARIARIPRPASEREHWDRRFQFGEDSAARIAAADQALYEAKAAGGGRAVHAVRA
jgi:hypothetical protein